MGDDEIYACTIENNFMVRGRMWHRTRRKKVNIGLEIDLQRNFPNNNNKYL